MGLFYDEKTWPEGVELREWYFNYFSNKTKNYADMSSKN
jgi:hypothetical protein